MYTIQTLSPDQLAILHKLTLYKYTGNTEHLISETEYNSLTQYLKGYAYELQAGHEDSDIPKKVINTDAFREGVEQAKKEVEMRDNRKIVSELKK